MPLLRSLFPQGGTTIINNGDDDSVAIAQLQTNINAVELEKRNVIDSYSKAEVDALVGTNSYNGYTTTQTDNLLLAKADKVTTYTKTDVDAFIASKADKADTYTKADVTTFLSGKINTSTIGAANGICPLNASSQIPTSYLPSFVTTFNARNGDVVPLSTDYDNFYYTKALSDAKYMASNTANLARTDQANAFTGVQTFSSLPVSNGGDATLSTQLTTKNYVDNLLATKTSTTDVYTKAASDAKYELISDMVNYASKAGNNVYTGTNTFNNTLAVNANNTTIKSTDAFANMSIQSTYVPSSTVWGGSSLKLGSLYAGGEYKTELSNGSNGSRSWFGIQMSNANNPGSHNVFTAWDDTNFNCTIEINGRNGFQLNADNGLGIYGDVSLTKTGSLFHCATVPTGNDNLTNKQYVDSSISTAISGSTVDLSGYLPKNNFIATGSSTIDALTLTSGTITTAPSTLNSLVNKNYVDSQISTLQSTLAGYQTVTNMSNYLPNNNFVATGTSTIDALTLTSGTITTAPSTANSIANKSYVDSSITSNNTLYALKNNTVLTGTSTINNTVITGGTIVNAPSSNNDIVNKQYVDNVITNYYTKSQTDALLATKYTMTDYDKIPKFSIASYNLGAYKIDYVIDDGISYNFDLSYTNNVSNQWSNYIFPINKFISRSSLDNLGTATYPSFRTSYCIFEVTDSSGISQHPSNIISGVGVNISEVCTNYISNLTSNADYFRQGYRSSTALSSVSILAPSGHYEFGNGAGSIETDTYSGTVAVNYTTNDRIVVFVNFFIYNGSFRCCVTYFNVTKNIIYDPRIINPLADFAMLLSPVFMLNSNVGYSKLKIYHTPPTDLYNALTIGWVLNGQTFVLDKPLSNNMFSKF
jgi:hypothetical protein